jgi:hypothetical protein
MFYRQYNGQTLTMVLVHVDDIIIASNDSHMEQTVMTALQNAYTVSDLGELRFFLGMSIQRDRLNRQLTITQSRFIDDTVKRFNLTTAPSTRVPLMRRASTDAPRL